MTQGEETTGDKHAPVGYAISNSLPMIALLMEPSTNQGTGEPRLHVLEAKS